MFYTKSTTTSTNMQENKNYIPMVQEYIRETMPNGAYQIIAKRLESKGIKVTSAGVQIEIRMLKKKPNVPVIAECISFFKENGIKLDNYCEDFIRKEDKK